MKAVSLWQPWASAMALGLKRIETRHWSTSYRGPMAIHAAKRWTAEERDFLEDQVRSGFYPAEAEPMHFGAIVAVGRLVNITRTEQLAHAISSLELSWGNYGPRRYGWLFEDIRPLPEPVPFRGAQGLFEVPDHVLAPDYRPPARPAPPRPAQGALL